MWLEEGLEPPRVVVERTEEYKREEDPVEQFLKDECIIDEDATVTRKALYGAWSRWCAEQGLDTDGSVKSMKRLFRTKQKKYGFTDSRLYEGPKQRPRGYKGLGLKENDDWKTGGLT